MISWAGFAAGMVFAVKASTWSPALALGGTIKYKKGNTGLG